MSYQQIVNKLSTLQIIVFTLCLSHFFKVINTYSKHIIGGVGGFIPSYQHFLELSTSYQQCNTELSTLFRAYNLLKNLIPTKKLSTYQQPNNNNYIASLYKYLKKKNKKRKKKGVQMKTRLDFDSKYSDQFIITEKNNNITVKCKLCSYSITKEINTLFIDNREIKYDLEKKMFSHINIFH